MKRILSTTFLGALFAAVATLAQTQQPAAQQQAASTQKASREQITNFKKAFSVCLEGKKYMVKY